MAYQPNGSLQRVHDLFGRHHLVKRVIERPQIGVDLVAQIAGQEAQALARLDRGLGTRPYLAPK